MRRVRTTATNCARVICRPRGTEERAPKRTFERDSSDSAFRGQGAGASHEGSKREIVESLGVEERGTREDRLHASRTHAGIHARARVT